MYIYIYMQCSIGLKVTFCVCRARALRRKRLV